MNELSQVQIMKKWLDKLQEDSWNLELLISGFSIFGLFQLKNFLYQYLFKMNSNDTPVNSFLAIFDVSLMVIFIGIQVFIICLLLHVFLRGLWIGSIGIRYVSGDIDYKKLNYNERFDNHLKRKVGSFDAYLIRLEKLSSVLFGLTFVLIFILLSLFLYFIALVLVFKFFQELLHFKSSLFYSTLVVIWAVLGSIVGFDFATFGLLKKIRNRRFAKFYWFVNRFVSFITLFFLWRPLYFNLIHKNKTRWLFVLTIPMFFSIYVYQNLDVNFYSIFISDSLLGSQTQYSSASSHTFDPTNYDDLREKLLQKNELSRIEVLSLPSHQIEGEMLEVFVKMDPNLISVIERLDSTIVPITYAGMNFFNLESDYEKRYRIRLERFEKDFRKSKKSAVELEKAKQDFHEMERERFDSNMKKVLNSAKNSLRIYVNEIEIPRDSMSIDFKEHYNMGEQGFVLYFALKNTRKGANHITLLKKTYDERLKLFGKREYTIPFYSTLAF